MAYTKEQYKEKVIEIFGNEYDIIGDFKGVTKRVKVRHNKCGKTYEPIARDLMTGRGCSHCYGRKRLSQEEAFNQIKEILGDEYLIISDYKNSLTPLEIKHVKCGHTYKASHNNIKKSHCKCPHCRSVKSKGEEIIKHYLKEHEIEHIREYRFSDCKYKNTLPFDFYIPILNACIEFQGKQHYIARSVFGGEEALEETIRRDAIKKKYCSDNNIKLLEIKYTEIKNIGNILDKELTRVNI